MAFKISLNGSNYVSEAREKAFHAALSDSDQVLKPAVQPVAQPDNHGNGHRRDTTTAVDGATSGSGATMPAAVQPAQTYAGQDAGQPGSGQKDYGRVLEGLERGLAQSYDHQSEMLRVHQQYLSNQASYADIFAALMQEQGTLFTSDNTAGERAEVLLQVLQSLNRSVEQFHHHQSETLDVHGQFLQQQATYAQAFIELLQSHYGTVLNGNGHVSGNGNGNGNGHDNGKGNGHGNGYGGAPVATRVQDAPPVYGSTVPAPVREAPTGPAIESQRSPIAEIVARQPTPEPPVQAVVASPATDQPEGGPGVSVEVLRDALLDIVSDKTGYPAEMLEVEMDMEADLGIDSIKRVEILGALQDAYPGLPNVEADTLAELRTLAQVLDYMADAAPSPTPDDAAPRVLEQAEPMVDGIGGTEAHAPTPTGIDAATLSGDLLAIVSDKTGYPAEMLELEMDMEADLGIDSIKRVEILGALQDQHPDLPEVETDALAELRTLAQILDYMAQGVGAEPEDGPDDSKKA